MFLFKISVLQICVTVCLEHAVNTVPDFTLTLDLEQDSREC